MAKREWYEIIKNGKMYVNNVSLMYLFRLQKWFETSCSCSSLTGIGGLMLNNFWVVSYTTVL